MRHRDRLMSLGRRRVQPPTPVDPRSLVNDPDHFEVQKRDETGLVASIIFRTERQALAFADGLVHLMAKKGEKGSVQIVWPNPRSLA
jgi:hypothetical protein